VREVGGLIERLEGDRVALLAFSGDAREVAPLTHDRTTLRALLERVTPDDNVVGGTDLGAALQRALALFDGRTGAHEAIVLLTDGEDLSGHGLEVARTAAEQGIRIYVVGMGTQQGGKIPVLDQGGRESFLTGGEGGEVVSALDGSSLEEIARVTGGEYLAATRSAAPLEELYQMRISRLEGRDLQGGKEWVPHDRFQWVLVLALGCMLLESGLRERIGRRRAPASAALLLVLPFGTGLDTSGLRDLSQLGDHGAALTAIEELLGTPEWGQAGERERAAALFDIGVARQRAERSLGAIEAFVEARDLAGPGELRLDAAYNIAALLLGEAEKVRATIPEISGGGPPPGAIGLQGPPGAGGAGEGDEQAPDPLDVAEQAYRGALTASVDRLRLDARDADTRANMELIRRRLKELEQIREQREEQEQEQQENQDQQEDSDQSQDGDPEDSQDQEDSEQQPPEDQEQEEQQPEDEQQGEDQEPPEPEESESEDEQQEGQPDPAEEEQMMSREEIQRLLDRLAEIEKQARAVQRALTERRRVPVDEDW
jgi:Ca-activated chloride channel family protein